MNPSFSVIIIGDFCTYFYLFRPSKWNDTKIFSDFGDDESEGSDAEYMDASPKHPYCGWFVEHLGLLISC